MQQAPADSGDIDLAAILPEARVRLEVEASSKKRALELASEQIVVGTPAERAELLKPGAIFDAFLGRERLGSTALGHGVAIPHGRLAGNGETLATFMRLKEGVDFDASDQKPVDLIFALLVPEDSTEIHLRILAALARLFNDEAFCQRLREAPTAADAHQLLVGSAS
ncbi:MAG: PTS sugar transporter subunit IIA [Pseudomonadota bacterium]